MPTDLEGPPPHPEDREMMVCTFSSYVEAFLAGAGVMFVIAILAIIRNRKG